MIMLNFFLTEFPNLQKPKVGCRGVVLRQGIERMGKFTRGTFRTMQVTTPPTESPFTRTVSIAAIIFSAYSGFGHLTILLSIWKRNHIIIAFTRPWIATQNRERKESC